MCRVMEELLDTSKHLEQKIDSIITNYNNQVQAKPTIAHEDSEELHLISSLPLGVDDFTKFDEKIGNDSHFRKRLVSKYKENRLFLNFASCVLSDVGSTQRLV